MATSSPLLPLLRFASAFTFALLAAPGCGEVKNDKPVGASGSGGAEGGRAGSTSGDGGSSAGTVGSGEGTVAGASNPNGGAVDAGGAGLGGEAAAGGMGVAAGGLGAMAVPAIWKSDGCGKPYERASGAKQTLPTMGRKDDDCNDQPHCGLWGQEGSTWYPTPLLRDHYVNLPNNYDPNKVYRLVLLGPGCGGDGRNIYALSSNLPFDDSIDNTPIRVGITPPHLYSAQDCFDDQEGDDSVDWVHYELLYDQLNAELCFDRNRVFAGGNSNGSWWANELGCKYAGDETRPIRGVIANTGGLPTDPAQVPTCSKAPMAGMWVHEVDDGANPFEGSKVAINRAMSVNGCTIGTNYDDATFDPFPIPGLSAAGLADDTCRKIRGCDPRYPLVVCPLPGNQHGGHDNVYNPGAIAFLKLFVPAAP